MTEQEIKDNNGNSYNVQLEPCPFCGAIPNVIFIGNNATKSKKIKIKCSNVDCRVEMINGAIYKSTDWLVDISIKSWNRRVLK